MPEVDQYLSDYFIAMRDNNRSAMGEALEVLDGGRVARHEHDRAALAIGGATTGGNIVPVPMSSIIVERLRQIEVIGPRSRQFTSPHQALDVPVAWCVGATLDYFAGSFARAPVWMRRIGLEWLFRLLRQPWRLRRQLAIPQFIWLVVRERLRQGLP